MIKFLPVYIALGVLFFTPCISYAGVANSPHDMYSTGKGTNPNVCSYCHIPHNAAGDKIWSDWGNEVQLTGGSSTVIGNMCYTCHDGTVTDVGQNTVFNTYYQQHEISAGKDCNMCHTVHDNTNGMFSIVPKTQSTNTAMATYCETCHDSTMYTGAEALGDHLAGTEHPYKDDGGVLDWSCNICHMMHAGAQGSTEEVSNPILRVTITDSIFCQWCHYDKMSVEGDGVTQDHTQHPANLGYFNSWGKVECRSCHDVHQPDVTGRAALLVDDNVDSAFCVTCHEETSTINGPAIGGNSHPVGAAFTTIGDTPSGSDIDDDDDGSPDYPGNSEVIVCETCHSVHDKNADAPALRVTNEASALCVNCHSDK